MEDSELSRQFTATFGTQPKIFSAPGRVNLIGEHTDYNDGFVMPSAIAFFTRVAISPRVDRKLVIRSLEFPQPFEFDVEHLPKHRIGAWCDYVLGVAVMLQEAGFALPGANLLVCGEVPIGAGLSSSAALEVATASALLDLCHGHLALTEIQKLCRRAENEFVGARVGIMDQFVSCMGKAGHALLLDCRSLEFKLVPIPASVRLVICNTMVKHELASNEYNLRREQCEEGVRRLKKFCPQIHALRDVSVEQLKEHAGEMPDVVFKRCLHVVEEDRRTLDGAACLTKGQLSPFGDLMRASHRSLRDLYEVSCRELDVMVEQAEGLPGYYGGRMTGGGFGGCTVNLVNAADAEGFAAEIGRRYYAETNIQPNVYIATTADGAASSGMR